MTTKICVVFNASFASNGQKSLNDVVDAGPSLLPDMVRLLVRFREYPVAFQADIRKAFFMIAVQEGDRKFLRFLWPNDKGAMVTWRLKKLPFGVNCSPFLLMAVLRRPFQDENAFSENVQFIELLEKSFYVHDCISSVPTEQDANEFRMTSTRYLKNAGMELRKWRDNVFEANPEAGKTVLGLP